MPTILIPARDVQVGDELAGDSTMVDNVNRRTLGRPPRTVTEIREVMDDRCTPGRPRPYRIFVCADGYRSPRIDARALEVVTRP
jgi:hypothetical protein